MDDNTILIIIYTLGAILSFYPFARFFRRGETFYDERRGVACAIACLVWPLLWSVWIFWQFLAFIEITFGIFIKPLQKLYDWCNKDNPVKKFGERNDKN